MKLSRPQHSAPAIRIALGLAVLGLATGAAFAAWASQADEIFLSMVEAGLSWCL
jgi:hypothetical protein